LVAEAAKVTTVLMKMERVVAGEKRTETIGVGTEPTGRERDGCKNREEGDEQEESDGAPDLGKQEIGKKAGNDDDEIEDTKNEVLLAETVWEWRAPAGNCPVHRDLVEMKRTAAFHTSLTNFCVNFSGG
jgi:hypothetical protein